MYLYNLSKTMNNILTPSYHQIGDEVVLDFQHCGIVNTCKVIAVHFYEGEVRYDVCIQFDHGNEEATTVLEQIGSIFVRTIDPVRI